MSRIADALRKVHPQEPWRQIVPSAITEESVDSVLADMGLSADDGPERQPDRQPNVAVQAGRPETDNQDEAYETEEPAASPFVPVAVAFDTPLTARLVIAPDSDPAAVEQYRHLAVTLHQAQSERQLKVIMVTGAMPADGKTLTATNLALTLSGSFRRKVLLIDADLRRPALQDVFGAPAMSGLHEALSAKSDRKLSVLQPTPFLSVLLAGRPDPNPVTGLSSPRMGRIIQDAAAHFDWVIIDTPPAAMLPDVSLLSMSVDGTLLVIRAGATPFGAIEQAIEALGRDRILGVVLNGVQSVNPGYGAYRYSDDEATAAVDAGATASH